MRWLTIVGYAGAALLLFLLFLYLTLPYEAISRWLLRRAEAAAGVQVQALSVDRLHPFGLRWHGVTVSEPGARREWVSFPTMTVEPVLPSLLSRRKVIGVEAQLSSGMIEGKVMIGQSSKGLQYQVDVERIEGLDLAIAQPLLPAVKGLNGRLSGNGSYEWTPDQPLYGTGTLFLEAEGVALGGALTQQLPVGVLKFDQVTCTVSLTQGRAAISNCTATGPSGQVTISGTVQLQMPVMRSFLSLRMQLALPGISPADGPPLTAIVSGPLGSPQYRLEGGVQLGPPPAGQPGSESMPALEETGVPNGAGAAGSAEEE